MNKIIANIDDNTKNIYQFSCNGWGLYSNYGGTGPTGSAGIAGLPGPTGSSGLPLLQSAYHINNLFANVSSDSASLVLQFNCYVSQSNYGGAWPITARITFYINGSPILGPGNWLGFTDRMDNGLNYDAYVIRREFNCWGYYYSSRRNIFW